MILKNHKYIEHEITLNIRFSEVDAMNVVWHGNYLKFFEDGREALGEKYKLNYLDFAEKGFFVPIVRSEIEHLSTVEYGHKIKVTTRLYESPAAKLIHEYVVVNLNTNRIAARGKTVQAFVNLKKELILNMPDFYKAWKSTITWTDIK